MTSTVPDTGREPEPHPCSYWHRRMYKRFAELGLRHTKGCGKPWAEHGELGECPKEGARP